MNAEAVDFVYYTVTDIEDAVSFYRDTLGLTAEMVDEDMGWAEFAVPPTTLALGEDSEGMPTDPGSGGAAVALAVEDVEAAVDELREAGSTVGMEPFDSGVCDMAMVEDPDGNAIMLHHRHDGTTGRRDPLP